MKFREFILKNLLADGDCLVGYDTDGNYIRIRKSDLATVLGGTAEAQSIQVQYSSDGSTWHDSYVSVDVYMRIKVGTGNWSDSIRISVSAFQIWQEANGGSGTVSDFLESIRGDAGQDADIRTVQLSDLNGYSDLLTGITTTLNNTKSSIITELTDILQNTVKEQYNELNLADVKEIKNLSENDYITIVTADGLRKVKLSALTSNVALTMETKDSYDSAVAKQKRILSLAGDKNGNNVDYTINDGYVLGTSDLYLNGQRLVRGTDYMENTSYSITMLTQIPISTDRMVFVAVPLSN